MELGIGGDIYGNLEWLRNGLHTGNAEVAQVAERLARSDSKALLAETLSWWAHNDPFGTIAWIHTQNTISSLAIGRMAGNIAARDLRLALNLGDQFSPAVRAAWMTEALSRAAVFDPVVVIDSLAVYRSESFHEAALDRALSSARSTLAPHQIADLAGTTPTRQSARQIALNWAQIDPIAAVNWALSLDESVQSSAVAAVIQGWQQFDALAALNWAQSHPDVGIPDDVIENLCRILLTCAGR
jgi:hypothetical protein